ncbi:unnamed protein product [Leptosia nina]|uniref:Uncharacterized protein n=1 Tax=Leptosia nina TaxID=320188 RepID=A0AAV1JF45_9NEOP
MSESKPEQHPLLFDDLSDDEHRISESPTYQRRIFSTGSGRAKYHVRGAATILKQWPDHMSSLLTYWWMGLAMIGFTVLIIYNSVLAIAVIPSPSKINKMPPKLRADDYSFDYTSHKTVYLHVVIDDKKLDLNTYLPYIEIVSKDHPGLKYNFDLLVNDTADLFDPKNDSQSNSLWKDKATQLNILKHTLPPDTKINIRHKSLTRYMNESPLRKVWRHLPHHLFGFLIRCISVWNKGGISIDPLLLTPKSPHPHYLEKVSNIFKDFEDTTKRRTKLKKSYKNTKKAKKVNNIRDIIEALENENSSIDEHQKTDNLEEAENKLFITVNKNNTQFTDKKYTFENESNVVERTNKKHKPNNEASSKVSIMMR